MQEGYMPDVLEAPAADPVRTMYQPYLAPRIDASTGNARHR